MLTERPVVSRTELPLQAAKTNTAGASVGLTSAGRTRGWWYYNGWRWRCLLPVCGVPGGHSKPQLGNGRNWQITTPLSAKCLWWQCVMVSPPPRGPYRNFTDASLNVRFRIMKMVQWSSYLVMQQTGHDPCWTFAAHTDISLVSSSQGWNY